MNVNAYIEPNILGRNRDQLHQTVFGSYPHVVVRDDFHPDSDMWVLCPGEQPDRFESELEILIGCLRRYGWKVKVEQPSSDDAISDWLISGNYNLEKQKFLNAASEEGGQSISAGLFIGDKPKRK